MLLWQTWKYLCAQLVETISWGEFLFLTEEATQWSMRNLIVNYESLQVNNYEIVINFFLINHNLTWYSAIVHKFTRIYPVCSTYELTKQFMWICVKNCTIDLKKNNLYEIRYLYLSCFGIFEIMWHVTFSC